MSFVASRLYTSLLTKMDQGGTARERHRPSAIDIAIPLSEHRETISLPERSSKENSLDQRTEDIAAANRSPKAKDSTGIILGGGSGRNQPNEKSPPSDLQDHLGDPASLSPGIYLTTFEADDTSRKVESFSSAPASASASNAATGSCTSLLSKCFLIPLLVVFLLTLAAAFLIGAVLFPRLLRIAEGDVKSEDIGVLESVLWRVISLMIRSRDIYGFAPSAYHLMWTKLAWMLY